MERPKSNFHQRQFSDGKLGIKAYDLDKIINQCTHAKKEILTNMNKITKNVKSHQNAWKSMENILKKKNESILKYKLPIEKEMHEKFKQMYESQITDKKRRLSKLLVYNEKDHITDSDLMNQEAMQFILANRREFGSPMKNISIEPTKIISSRKSLNFDLSPEEIILQDIQEIRSKKSSPKKITKLSPIKLKKKLKKTVNITEDSLKEMNPRNKFIFSELKKIDPKTFRNPITNKRIDNMISSIQRIQQNYEKIKKDQGA